MSVSPSFGAEESWTLNGKAVPASIAALLWDTGRRTRDLRCDDALLTRRVLNEGSWSACQWLRETIGDQVIEQQLRDLEGRGVDRRALRLWQVLLGLPDSLVTSWLAAPERQIWDRRSP